jgi:hypothetical protein
MPWSYAIDAERRLVLTRAWGELTGAEILEHQQQLSTDPQHDPSFSQLLDFTEVTTLDHVSAEAIRIASKLHLFGPGSRRALVIFGTVGYGLARMFETYRSLAGGREQIRIFTDLQDARAWLDGDLGPATD